MAIVLDGWRLNAQNVRLEWTLDETFRQLDIEHTYKEGSSWGAWRTWTRDIDQNVTERNAFVYDMGWHRFRLVGTRNDYTDVYSNVLELNTNPSGIGVVTAKRDGSDIIVQFWQGYGAGSYTYDIREGDTILAEGLKHSQRPGNMPEVIYRVVNPNPTVPHSYTARWVRDFITITKGEWSDPSNVIFLASPPSPPIDLTPNGAIAETGQETTFAWTHNPVDGTAQTVFELWYQAAGDETWRIEEGTTDSSVSFVPEAEAGGDQGPAVLSWMVRTKGVYQDSSDWSDVATLTLIDRPEVTIIAPTGIVENAVLSPVWETTQGQEYGQTAFEMVLVSGELVVETVTGTGPSPTATFQTPLRQGEYTVRVRVATEGVWSDWAESTFTADFDSPAPPVVAGAWVEAEGGVSLTVDAGGQPGPVDLDVLLTPSRFVLWDALPGPVVEVVEPLAPATARLLVERFTDGWELVADLTEPGTILDPESPSHADIRYRVTALSVEGAPAFTEIIVQARSGALWLSAGDLVCRLPFNPTSRVTAGRARALKQYAGRQKPVTIPGEALSRVVSVQGTTADHPVGGHVTADVEALTALAHTEEALFLFRDPDGRRIFGTVPSIDMTRQAAASYGDTWNGFWAYSFALTESEE